MKMKLHNRGAGRGAGQAFTLVELLVVIAIIGVLAALILPLAGSVARVKKENTAQAEMQQIETALENYKAKYGAYPPSNPKSPLINQLYYELSGVTNNNGFYQTLDSFNSVSTGNFSSQFNVGGIVNCSHGSGEDTVFAKDFLPGLKSTQVVVVTNKFNVNFAYLVTSVGGPDAKYNPAGMAGNPFRYVNPGTNNPNSYDLWVQLSINTTPTSPNYYLICNWQQQVLHNSPMP
jgi:prepilin-type N-terminal cleavage/methylation domain-containing protein